ncbi:MAG: DNA cytosine methyltransferase [Terricaulis sp.]|nr:DNA cytosine methyltransferase [Terricaulis sp.]
MPRPIAIDLFAGAGGLSLGLEQAGFDVVAAVEIDPVHAAVHKFNFPDCAVLATSVVGLSGKRIRAVAGIGRRKVDLVAGGAPCQGFSMIGQRALDDPRNSLVREFVRIVRELNADYFIFENVKGLTLGKQKSFLNEIVAEFEGCGYNVRKPWKVLNAAEYGAPQNRERLILFGAKKGLAIPEYPAALFTPADEDQQSLGLPIGPSCSDALADLPDAEKFAALLDRDWVKTKTMAKPKSDYARAMRCVDDASWGYGYARRWDPTILTGSMRTDHSDISRRRFKATEGGDTEPVSRFFRLHANGLSNTLRAGTDAARGAFTSPRPIHYKYARCVTVREMARLHGFPDWFRLHATKWHGARQIGNSVPPPLARAVGASVVRAMGHKPRRPKRVLELGNTSLVEIGMAEAAALFGIEVPIGRRDKKSGAKKRKQWEIEAERLAA